MSLVSVHVNRSPCAGRVEAVEHRPGRFLDARDPAASAENESASLAIGDAEGRGSRLLVRQVAGLLARRIVCATAVGDRLERGQRIGMIKFGSRAEVYVPVEAGFDVAVKIGNSVKAGETILGRFR
jgi:phosphatidylserine decarboxylase